MPKKNWWGEVTSRFLPATKRDVEQLKETIMANTQNLLAEIGALKTKVDNQTAQLAAFGIQVEKVGGETDTLIEKIAGLEDAIKNGDTPQAVVDAFNEVKTASEAQQVQLDTLGTKLGVVDSKVDDKVTTPTPPVEG